MPMFHTASQAQTRKLAASLAKKLKGGGILALYGPLGSGKTTFVKGLTRALGIKSRIISPTFVIIGKYPLAQAHTFYHFDLYRLKNTKELEELGFSEIISGKKAVVAIEWPGKVKKLLPKKTIRLQFAHGRNPKERIITINNL
ncbi:MAG: tRNA (adenosine(37)-N6)-threonylcarbamoyltransferase complex ATPase subunit type 1 TsaE [Candidatus Doudnabacteria bacterium]|nr:tRNA (adenosine(37)-N6)-threonylcarbamoyltransferase complex ATPase subunit type 1 TsaE [Candidatus Doudnabacteria bacterium]